MCFVFKQKTAYEMRISDWSSDVCSSDLLERELAARPHDAGKLPETRGDEIPPIVQRSVQRDRHRLGIDPGEPAPEPIVDRIVDNIQERRRALGRAPCRERVCQYV